MTDELDKKWQTKDIVKSATFELVEETTGEKLKVVVIQDCYGLNIKPEGYGDGLSPITLDFFKGGEDREKDPLRVFVWSDKEEEDPSHIISLDLVKNEEKK